MRSPISTEEAEVKLKERGFCADTFRMGTEDGAAVISASTSDPMAKHGAGYRYSICVNLKTGEFEMRYTVPKSCCMLTTQKCGAFERDEHFELIRKEFVERIEVLHSAFEKERR